MPEEVSRTGGGAGLFGDSAGMDRIIGGRRAGNFGGGLPGTHRIARASCGHRDRAAQEEKPVEILWTAHYQMWGLCRTAAPIAGGLQGLTHIGTGRYFGGRGTKLQDRGYGRNLARPPL